ncbi:unnamed protein product [Notodromas monacha]|uniref:Carbonic anhydrase n=1 Tax=Notodromas monacha TaxID=399045 RepID=A0A7R9G9A1_9CRUS|nr:unnamed protein product [Notodromas monacha]CAG0912634.1 unnamed protein product [Notodromas monacha]
MGLKVVNGLKLKNLLALNILNLFLYGEFCPHTWAVHFPLASGKRQSPIDIPSGRGEAVNFSSGLAWTYDSDACDRITNTGHGWKLLVSGNGELWGGPLPSKFKLEQIHAHWGCTENEGSEHTVDGVAYPGEIHLVHWDSEKYSSFAEAANADGGLAVLGVFITVGDQAHDEIQKIVDALELIPNKDMTENLAKTVDPLKLLPESKAFWNYEGSLTTPPCLETVNWIVFKTPLTVSKEQISAFRALRAYAPEEDKPGDDEFGGQVVQNFRPPMPLCGRVVRDCC